MTKIVIEAGCTEKQYWRDLWRYRELFFILAWKDIAVRYRQTFAGVAWALIRPLLTMLVLTAVFGRIARLPSEGGAPYALLVYAAVLPWQFFSTAMSEASSSLVQNANLVSKVYFPRLIIPAATVITSSVDFVVSLSILIAMMLWYQHWPGWRIVILPCFIVLTFGIAMGVGIWLSALNVQYRDFRFIVPFILQFGMYVSPVGFSSSMVPAQWRVVYSMNPMVGAIDGFRWALLGGDETLYLPGILASAVLAILLCASGIWYFRSTERTFADVI